MRQYILTCSAAAFGAIFGYVGATRANKVNAGGAEKAEVRELVVLNEKSEAAARLDSLDGRTVLRIYSSNASPALEFGVDVSRSTRFLHYFGPDGRVLAALNSSPPNGETTLYLGDEGWETRMIAGAIRADIQPSTDPHRKVGNTNPRSRLPNPPVLGGVTTGSARLSVGCRSEARSSEWEGVGGALEGKNAST